MPSLMGKHRRPLSPGEAARQRQEDNAYRAWCLKHQLDPEDVESALSYEGNVGYLFIEDPGYLGEHL